jgi:hypothetical protein
MYICPKCKKKMRCELNGVICRWGKSHCYAGDKFKCPKCEFEVIACNSNPYNSDKEVHPKVLVQMD